MRSNSGHLDFNLILLPSPAADSWVSWVLSAFSSSLENDAAYAVLIGSNFLWTANSVNDWPFLYHVMSALPLRLTYMSLIFCSLAMTLSKLHLTFESALSVDFCHVWVAFWGFTLYPAALRSMEMTVLKVEDHKTENKMYADMHERYWHQSQFQFYLVTKFCSRWKWVNHRIICCIGQLWKMTLHTMFWWIQTFSEQQINSLFLLSWMMTFCVWHVSIRFCLSTVTLPKLNHLFVSTLPVDFFTCEPNF